MNDSTEFHIAQGKRASEITELASTARNKVARLTADLEDLLQISGLLDRMEAIAYEISGSNIAALARELADSKDVEKKDLTYKETLL